MEQCMCLSKNKLNGPSTNIILSGSAISGSFVLLVAIFCFSCRNILMYRTGILRELSE
uniref:Uncharacterized protein n=1 Tax=Acidithiobacillus ferrianus TaxID=2678518 RepID=A0A845ULP8_9PROT|nr:hypothetical protein [Acidithiobacillus ferrianus]